jgi:hypothetical protein
MIKKDLTTAEWKLLRKTFGLAAAKRLLASAPGQTHECHGCTEIVPADVYYCGLCAGRANYGYEQVSK